MNTIKHDTDMTQKAIRLFSELIFEIFLSFEK